MAPLKAIAAHGSSAFAVWKSFHIVFSVSCVFRLFHFCCLVANKVVHISEACGADTILYRRYVMTVVNGVFEAGIYARPRFE
jgi:hypothetical protein